MRGSRLAALCLLASTTLAAQSQCGILPADPASDARRAPIEALRTAGPALAGAFTRHRHENTAGEQMPYRLFTPAPLIPGRTYPLIVFLHGTGGSGTDNEKQLQGANVFGALVWALLATQPIDPARIYVTGHSMGGAGTWHMLAERPRFFAAGVPVCGHPLPATAPWIKDVPVWNFHGVADDIEPVETSRVMIDALRKAGGEPRHTEYAGVGHDVFMWAYTEPALVEWLFARRW